MKALFYSLCIIWVVTMLGCNDSSDNPSSSETKPIMVVWVSADNEYWVNDSTVYIDNVEVEGFVLGSPMPQVQKVLINGSEMTNLEIYEEEEGLWFEAIQIGGQLTGSKEVSVVLDKGMATGTVTISSLPLSITSPQEGDSISYGSNLVITWTGNATYTELDVDAEDSIYNYYKIIDDSITTGKTLTVPGNILFSHSLKRIWLHLYDFNGTYPKVGATANMEGTSDGFLMATNCMGTENQITIDVKNSGARKVLTIMSKSEKKSYRREFLRRAAARLLGAAFYNRL